MHPVESNDGAPAVDQPDVLPTYQETDPADDLHSEVGRNSGGLLAARLIAALSSVVALPFVIGYLGMARFGLWESIAACVSLSTLITDPGAGTLLWKMSVAWGQGDQRALKRFVRFGIAVSLALPLLFVPAALLFQARVMTMFGVAAEDAASARRVLVVLSALVVFAGINGTLGALNSAMQRARTSSLALTIGQVTMYAVSIAGLRLGFDFTAMLAGAATGQLVTMGALVIGARSAGPIPHARGNDAAGPAISTARYFGVFCLGRGASFLRGQSDRIVLAVLASPVWTGYYSVAARLAQLLVEVGNLFYVPTIAAAGAMTGARSWGGVRRLYRSVMPVVSLLGGITGFVLIGLAGPIVLLWVGQPSPEAASMLRILAMGTLAAVAIAGPGTAICKGIGRPELELRYVIVSLLANIVLTIGLVILVGPVGTVIASSASWALGSFYFAAIIHTAVKLPRAPTRRAIGTLVGSALAAALVFALLNLKPAMASRQDAALAIAVCVPLGIAALLAIGSRFGGAGYRDAGSLAIRAWRRLTLAALPGNGVR